MRNRDFEPTPMIQAQWQLWNQWLDTQRSLWTLWAPWLQVTPWFAHAASGNQVDKIEQEAIVDGMPDPLEIQARSWNHFLDANKQFWSAFGWPMAELPSMNGAQREEAELEEADENEGSDEPAPARKARARAARH